MSMPCKIIAISAGDDVKFAARVIDLWGARVTSHVLILRRCADHGTPLFPPSPLCLEQPREVGILGRRPAINPRVPAAGVAMSGR